MTIASLILATLGLALFEIVNSIDNAIINAEVLRTMQPWAKRWFLSWGLIFAVFIVRGLLPWLIIWATVPSLGPVGALTAAFTSNPSVQTAIESSTPVLLAGGGMFLVLLFFYWIFLEEKNIGLPHERFFMRQGGWFYAAASVVLLIVIWFGLRMNSYMAFGAALGSAAFFITHGFKHYAEDAGQKILTKGGRQSDIGKIFYLEAIDTTFSIDGVLGAFAFTLSVPIIILGNGIGAFVVRQMTIGNIERIKKYAFLKNGAMYSILFLGIIMILDAFELHIPPWISPVATFIIVGYFFQKSRIVNKFEKEISKDIRKTF
jgi:hypothetical protein